MNSGFPVVNKGTGSTSLAVTRGSEWKGAKAAQGELWCVEVWVVALHLLPISPLSPGPTHCSAAALWSPDFSFLGSPLKCCCSPDSVWVLLNPLLALD